MEQPLTRKDLEAFGDRIVAQITARISAAEARMEEKIHAVEQRLNDHSRTVADETENKLLTAFRRDREQQNIRLQRVEAAEAIDSDRIAGLEKRLRALEERLDFPHYPGRVS